VARGQLQFINGGWSMHDEACTHYVSMIENTALGHRFLKDQFDYVPTVGWQIDPFGHSSVQASLLSAEAGFDALYFARIDWQEKSHRLANNDMEMVWRASPSLGADAEVFTGAFLDGNYGPPHGLCFDGTCNDNFPIMDDLCMEDDNVQDYIDLVVETAMKYANYTRGDQTLGAKNIMFLMGDDFQYENADTWFKNLDKVMRFKV
jgi:alpha-mannosidase